MSSPSQELSDEQNLIDTLCLTDAEWGKCVAEMDRHLDHNSTVQDRRRDERLPYRNVSSFVVSVKSHDGRQMNFKARPYDLSQYGISFLHGSYMHVGLSIETQLMHREFGITTLHATVRCCIHIKDEIHRVGAEFEESINPDDYLRAEAG